MPPPTPARRVLIAGCGYVGAHLGGQLAADGHTVFGLRRSPSALPPGIAPVTADLTKPASLGSLPEAIDTIVYAASPGASQDEAYRRAYVEGLSNVLRAPSLASTPPRRVLFVASTAVYGQTRGEWVDEQSPTEPTHFSGKRLLEAEALLERSGLETVSLRCGGIYGPGRGRLIDQVRRGEADYDPRAPQYTNRIHRDDVAGALEHLMTLSSPARVYLGVDHDPAERRVVLQWIAERLGVRPPRGEQQSERGGRESRSNKRCRNARLVSSGYSFRYPTFREGYEAILGASKDNDH